jgi:hypothetical protein
MSTTLTASLGRVAAVVCASLSLACAQAQQFPVESAATPPTAATPSTVTDAAAPVFSPEELEQLVAPLALYPDSLLSQILMASTYPLEIVEADRWVRANPNLRDDALATGLNQKDWDPSVKSLAGFPDVLAMMSENLETTRKIGDAFIAQQQDVMDAVQRLRGKAKQQGNLESNQQQAVRVEAAPAGAQTQTIIIEPANPEIIYVPTYDPVVVYGGWPYAYYPPYPYYVRPYWPGAYVSFGLGFTCGSAWGWAWGDCDWGRHSIYVDCNRNSHYNHHIDRGHYQGRFDHGDGRGRWQHDSIHRRGVGYRDAPTARHYGGMSDEQTRRARDSYRGRAETGRRDLGRGDADQFRGPRDRGAPRTTSGAAPRAAPAAPRAETRASPPDRPGDTAPRTTSDATPRAAPPAPPVRTRASPSDRPDGAAPSTLPGTTPATRPGAATTTRPTPQPSTRPAPVGGGRNGLSGIDRGGSSARESSSRGSSSRSTPPPAPRPSGSPAAGSSPRGGGPWPMGSSPRPSDSRPAGGGSAGRGRGR